MSSTEMKKPEIYIEVIFGTADQNLLKTRPKVKDELFSDIKEDLDKKFLTGCRVTFAELNGRSQSTVIKIYCTQEDDRRNISNGGKVNLLEEIRQIILKKISIVTIFTIHLAPRIERRDTKSNFPRQE